MSSLKKKKSKKISRRIPVPQKPPKVIADKKAYNRKKLKAESLKKKKDEE